VGSNFGDSSNAGYPFRRARFQRTYWDFFTAFGLFFSVFVLFAAAVAWQLAGFTTDTLATVRGIQWSLAICFLAIAILSWMYAFTIPVVFSSLIALCLIAAAWLPKPRG